LLSSPFRPNNQKKIVLLCSTIFNNGTLALPETLSCPQIDWENFLLSPCITNLLKAYINNLPTLPTDIFIFVSLYLISIGVAKKRLLVFSELQILCPCDREICLAEPLSYQINVRSVHCMPSECVCALHRVVGVKPRVQSS